MAESSPARPTPCVEIVDPAMVAIYRTWTPARRLSASFEMIDFARTLVRGRIRSLHPDWSDERIDGAVAERFQGGPA